MKRMIQVSLLILLLLFSFLLFSGCASDPFDQTASQFFAAYQKQDYTAMYGLLTPQACSLVGEESFTEYYQKVYNLLKIEKITLSYGETVTESTRKVYTYTAALHSSEYGDLSYEMQLEVLQKANFYLVEWTPANVVPDMQWNDRIYKSTVKGKRGEIFDAYGRPLVRNLYAVTVYAETDKIKNTAASVLSDVCATLGLEYKDCAEKVNNAIQGSQDTAVLATYLPGELSQEQEDAITLHEGIKVNRTSITPIRYYPYGSAAAQVLGFSSPVTAEDRESNSDWADLPEGTRVGRSGVEKAYDFLLQGTDGFEIYLLSDTGTRKTVLYTHDAINGKDLTLTLDILLQQSIQEKMTELYGEVCSGSVVILNPETGAVEAMASYPSYDANLYAFNTARPGAADLYTEESRSPTLNRAIQGLYPPGSIFKSMTALMGLQSGAVNVSTVFPYADEIEYLDYEKDRWRPAGSNWSYYIVRQAFRTVSEERKGVMDMNRGLIWSDNIYFGWLAMKIGKDDFISYAKNLGTGEAVPFDLPVLSSKLANDVTNYDSQKFLADAGFGQAELLFTPLQLACMYSQFGNGGTIMQPYLLQCTNTTNELGELVPQEVTQPKVWKEGIFSASNVQKVRDIMEKTAKEGTGKSGTTGLDDMRICAKTGTAQTGNGKTEIGWYAGYVIDGGRNSSVLVNVDGPVGGDTAIKFKMVHHVFEQLQDEAGEE